MVRILQTKCYLHGSVASLSMMAELNLTSVYEVVRVFSVALWIC